MSSANSIKVVARFRPQNKIELESGGEPIVSFDGGDTCSLNVRTALSPRIRTPVYGGLLTDSIVVGRGRWLLHLRPGI